MKDIQLYYVLLLLSILFISTKSIHIYYLADALTNSTATYVFQNEMEAMVDNFVYLGFDFVFHGEIAPHQANSASFEITGPIDSIKYAFTEKESYKIDNVDDINEWKDTEFGNGPGLSINRTDKKMKTLLLKVFLKDKNEDIVAVNLGSFPPEGYEESTDALSDTTHSDSDSKSEKSFIEIIKDLINKILDLIKKLFGFK